MGNKLITIFKGNPINSEMINNILNDNGIEASLKNELMGTIAPWQVADGGLDPVEVQILEKDKDKALKLIEEFNKSA